MPLGLFKSFSLSFFFFLYLFAAVIDLVAGNFSLKFLSLFVHVSGFIEPITRSGYHWKDLCLLKKWSIDNATFGQREGCALGKILGSPSGTQPCKLGCPEV